MVETTGCIVRHLRWDLMGRERAIANARAASTELARRRVERNEVELYMLRRAKRVSRSA